MRYVKIVLGVLLMGAIIFGTVLFLDWKKRTEEEERIVQYQQLRKDPNVVIHAGGILPVEFQELKQQNPDIYAWITVPGTDIDEPVVQHPADNGYYLTHNVNGAQDADGAVFSEDYNQTDFSDIHTVLYGCNAPDGRVFSHLTRFEDETFFKENKIINIFTPDALRQYQIFAAYVYDDRHLLQTYDCTDERIFEAYIRQVLTQRNLYSQLDEEVSIQAGDRILTLSTGHTSGQDKRYLVQAVLVEEKRYSSAQTGS